MSVTWKRVQTVILNEMGQSLSEDMCRNLAEQLNEPETSGPCHGEALEKLITHRDWNCTFENPCEGCKDRRPHPHDEVVHLTDQKAPGKTVLHAAYCACTTCLGAGVV